MNDSQDLTKTLENTKENTSIFKEYNCIYALIFNIHQLKDKAKNLS